jgi:hypothetical protein
MILMKVSPLETYIPAAVGPAIGDATFFAVVGVAVTDFAVDEPASSIACDEIRVAERELAITVPNLRHHDVIVGT